MELRAEPNITDDNGQLHFAKGNQTAKLAVFVLWRQRQCGSRTQRATAIYNAAGGAKNVIIPLTINQFDGGETLFNISME